MANNKASKAFSGVKSSINLLNEWRSSKEARDSYFRQADRLLSDNDDDLRQITRRNAEEKGQKISKAGVSGIDLSSFNDAFLSEDLKNADDIRGRRARTEAEAAALRNKAYGERRKKWEKSLSFSAGLLSDWYGFLF